jgi:CheY-like chemotaxis protein
MTSSQQLLVVDDDRLLVRTLTDILHLKGYQAEGAHSGEAAIIAVEHRPYDIVLMDIRMPGLSGVEALRAIRHCSPQTRVVLMTAYIDDGLAAEAEGEGVVRVLPKPVNVGEVLTLLESLSGLGDGSSPKGLNH